MMPPSITKYGSPVRLDAQIVALRPHCARTALKAPPLTPTQGATQQSVECESLTPGPTHPPPPCKGEQNQKWLPHRSYLYYFWQQVAYQNKRRSRNQKSVPHFF